MPKELIMHCGRDDFADLQIQWGRDELGEKPDATEPKVRVFVGAADYSGGAICYHPGEGSSLYIGPGEAIGPVDLHLDRAAINRLIRVLRRARDQAYGRDE